MLSNIRIKANKLVSVIPRKPISIIEVGLRDGLQNEQQYVPLHIKKGLLDALAKTGLKNIEAGAFVSSDWVPQMKDSVELFTHIQEQREIFKRTSYMDIQFTALVPNMVGFDTASNISGGIDEIAVFGSASDEFSQKNINCNVEDSLRMFEKVVKRGLAKGFKVRGYVSCVMGCPYSGNVSPVNVGVIVKKMLKMGCHQVSLGDTIGQGTSSKTRQLLYYLLHYKHIDPDTLAVHFHNTNGRALENIKVALEHGITTIDSSISGLGGCPYAGNGATGNVATEDVVYMLHDLGLYTGIDMNALFKASDLIDTFLDRKSGSHIKTALRTK